MLTRVFRGCNTLADPSRLFSECCFPRAPAAVSGGHLGWASIKEARMKLLLSCALSASLQGAAAEGLLDARNWLPTLGPNFDAAAAQVEALSYVQYVRRKTLSVCRDPKGNALPKHCHDALVDALSFSKKLDRNATRECQVTCDGINRCIEPCKKAALGVAYGRWEADRKILMTYLGIKQTVWGRLGEEASNLGQGIYTLFSMSLVGWALLALINLGLIALPFKLIANESNPRYCLMAVNACFAVYFVEMCLFCPYMVIIVPALIMWFLFCDWIFGFKKISEDEADDMGFLGEAREIFTRVLYTLTPLAAAVVVACALGL